MNRFGYLADLAGATFDDVTRTTWIQALPLGTYDHPVYGTIEATPEKVQTMAMNVNNGVRETELDIDYDHKAQDGKAAGWIKQAQARDNGLWVLVEWTKKAYKAIKDKEYRYFSPEMVDEWQHPKTKAVHKHVLFGGGITNRPFLKDILPLNMSELFAEQHPQEGTSMDPKLLRKLLGLPEDATEDQVTEAVSKLPDDAVIGAPPVPAEPQTPTPGDGIETDHQVVAAAEGLPQEVIRLKESDNPDVKALATAFEGLFVQNQTLSTALQLSETARTVQKLTEPVDGKALPAGTVTKLNEVLLAPSQKGIVELMEGLVKTGFVNTKETITDDARQREGNTDAIKQFTDKVDEKLKNDENLQYADAVTAVAKEDPKLFAEYRGASYADAPSN